MKIKALTPKLRAEVAQTSATLKDAVAAAQAGAVKYLAHQEEWKNFYANRLEKFGGQAFGETHPFYREWAARLKEHNESEMWVKEVNAVLTGACHATRPVLDRVFGLAYQQIHAEVEALLQPYYPAHLLKGAAQATELERNLLIFHLRLTNGESHLFHETLDWARLLLKVLEDIAAGQDVFTLTPEVAKAA